MGVPGSPWQRGSSRLLVKVNDGGTPRAAQPPGPEEMRLLRNVINSLSWVAARRSGGGTSAHSSSRSLSYRSQICFRLWLKWLFSCRAPLPRKSATYAHTHAYTRAKRTHAHAESATSDWRSCCFQVALAADVFIMCRCPATVIAAD